MAKATGQPIDGRTVVVGPTTCVEVARGCVLVVLVVRNGAACTGVGS